MHFVAGSRCMVFGMSMATGRSTVDAGCHGRGCRKTGGQKKSESSTKCHLDLYLFKIAIGLSLPSLWQETQFDKKNNRKITTFWEFKKGTWNGIAFQVSLFQVPLSNQPAKAAKPIRVAYRRQS
jgi:hypothetical protein